MEKNQDNQNIPMTEEELDLFFKDISQQVTESEEKAEEPIPSTPKKPAAEKKKKKPSKKISLLYLILLLFFAAIFVFSAVYLISWWTESQQQQKDYEDLAAIVESIKANQATRPTDPPATNPPTYPDGLPIIDPTMPTVQEILPEYQAHFDMNNDLVGWIKVDGTKINYPVLQSTPENKDYYIDHDFYGRARGCGAIYVRESCDVFAPSDNVTMYGHHMRDMSMFAGLDYYRKQSFWEEHQTFTFDTLFEHHTYQVIAVFKTSANPGQGFSFHQFENAANEEEFNEFINTVKSLAMYDTGISAEYGDKLVCLTTCEYTLSNGRLVVVGKRIS